MERFKMDLSSEMLTNREMENPDFSFAQVCSNDHVLFQHSASPL